MTACAPRSQVIGTLTSTYHDTGKVVTSDLVCCVHCGYTWKWEHGSGRIRGWCGRHGGFVCGREYCVKVVGCNAWQRAMIDNCEQGLPVGHQSATILVPGDVPRSTSRPRLIAASG